MQNEIIRFRSNVMKYILSTILIGTFISGASIALAAVFLILPGFLTDVIGFLLLFPFTRKLIINYSDEI